MGDGAPPDELAMHWKLKRYPGSLPEPGGMYDQPAQLMHRMAVFANIYNAVNRIINMTGKEIHGLSIAERRIIKSLKDIGLF